MDGRADWLEPFPNWILTAGNAGEIAVKGSLQEKKVLAQIVFGSNLVLDCKKARGSCVKPWSHLLDNSSSGGMVPTTGLEPVRCYPLEPESSASANSATWAQCFDGHFNTRPAASGQVKLKNILPMVGRRCRDAQTAAKRAKRRFACPVLMPLRSPALRSRQSSSFALPESGAMCRCAPQTERRRSTGPGLYAFQFQLERVQRQVDVADERNQRREQRGHARDE